MTKKSRGNKGNDNRVILRRKDVREMLQKGYGREDLIDYCKVKWGVRKSTVDADIKLVKKNIAITLMEDEKNYYNDFIMMRRQRIKELTEIADQIKDEWGEGEEWSMGREIYLKYKKLASEEQEKLEKLLKLYQPDTQVNIQNNTLDLKNLSFSELKELLKNNDE